MKIIVEIPDQVVNELFEIIRKNLIISAPKVNPDDLLSVPLRQLSWNFAKTRLRHCLINFYEAEWKKDRVITLEGLCQKKRLEIIKTKNLGEKSLAELECLLATHDLKLGMTKEEIEIHRTQEHSWKGLEIISS